MIAGRALACALLAMAAPAFALEPCSTGTKDYFRGVVDVADAAVPGGWLLDVEFLPSSLPEAVARVTDGRLYFIQFRSSLWYEGTALNSVLPKKGVRVAQADVPRELTDRIVRVVGTAVKAAQKGRRGGLDGETYRFDMPPTGCGETWSPDATSPDARLAALVELIRNRTNASGKRELQSSTQALQAWLDDLEKLDSR
jgi:hypothetical protein